MIQPADALRFLWSGQNGLFVLAHIEGAQVERRLYTMDDALRTLKGNDRFGPLARGADEGTRGQVAETGNVLWVDLDERDRVDERFAEAGFPPSLLIDSGHHGFWAFWKLGQPISSDEIEAWNRRLAIRFGADRGACEKVQLARLPGSYRPETGRVAETVRFSAAVYEPDLLETLRERWSWRSRLRLRRAR